MAERPAFTGLPAEVLDAEKTRRWSTRLVQAVLVVLVVGVVLAAILWFVSADGGALTLCIAFAVSTGLMVIRQALLAERW
jgi:multisubunit Na+/H+ antiporter MnhB subunit